MSSLQMEYLYGKYCVVNGQRVWVLFDPETQTVQLFLKDGALLKPLRSQNE